MLLDPGEATTYDVLGPTIQIAATTGNDDNAPCIMFGTIPPGVAVPLHSHPDPETFLARSGTLEGLVVSEGDGDARWAPLEPGDVFHVPAETRHAFRNRSTEPALAIIVTTARLGRFLGEVGTPVAPGQPSKWPPEEEAVRRLLATAERYGHWNATPEENAAVGLRFGMIQRGGSASLGI